MNSPIIHQGLLAIGILSTVGAISLVIPEMAKTPALILETKTAPAVFPSNSELRAIRLKNGDTLAVIKTWNYTYNPAIPPSTDLKIIREAIASNGYSLILLESDGNPPILGWYLQPDKQGNWQLFSVTKQFKKDNKEIFND